MSGVKYNISFDSGNSNSLLEQMITLMKESVAQTTGLQSAVSSLNVSAVKAIGGVESAVTGLSDSLSEKLKPAVSQTKTEFEEASNKTKSFGDRLEDLGKGAFYLNNIRDAIGGIVDDLNNATRPGIDLDTQLHETQAIIGGTADQMKQLSDSARQNAKDFGVDAAQGVAAYQVYLAGLGPEIGRIPAALAEMGQDATIISKQMGGDVQGAAQTMTTAVQQFGVSLEDPIQAAHTMTAMMNIMSAAAREGSAEFPDLKSALEQTGMMAKTANVSFTETSAALEVLANRGKKGAEGGVALRNALSILSEGDILPPQTQNMLHMAGIDVDALGDKTLTLAQRLDHLKPIMNDTAAMTLLFGRENVAAGVALVQNADEITSLTQKIGGTNAAMDQANIIMSSYEEHQNRISAAIKDVGISIFNAAQPFLPFITMGMGALQVLANLSMSMSLFSTIAKMSMWPAIGSLLVGIGSWIAETTMLTLAQLGLNAAMSMNPIGALIIGIAAAVTAVTVLIKYWHEIWDAIAAFGKWVWDHSPFNFLINVVDNIFPGFKKAMGELFDWVGKKFEALTGWFKKSWHWIKGLFGGDKNAASDAAKAAVENIQKQLDAGITGITKPAVVQNDDPTHGFKKGMGRGHSGAAGESVARDTSSGGSRPTVITITIQKLQDNINIYTGEIKEGAKQAAQTVVNEVLMALNSVDNKGGMAYGD